MNVLLGAVGTCMAFFGIFMNLYVIIVLLLNKKARTTSEWILLHLGWCGLGASFINLFLISPSIIMARWLTSTGSFCSFVGASVLTLQLLTVWSICALSADRCAAIASPLRYTQLVTAKRVAVFFFFIWVLSIGTMMTAFIVSNDIRHENHAPDDRPFRNDTSYYTNSDSSNHNNSNPSSPIQSSASTTPDLLMSSTRNFIANKTTSESDLETSVKLGFNASSSPTVANMIFDVDRSAYGDRAESGRSHFEQQSGSSDITNYTSISLDQRYKMNEHVENESLKDVSRNLEYRQAMGLCLPRVYYTSVPSLIWASEWVFVILVAPLCTILICDLVVLSIARKQRHRIVMALYQITLSAQATVVRSKGATPPQLWLNRSIPARSRACRAVLEDLAALVIIHLPLILILVFEMLTDDHHAPLLLHMAGSLSLFFFPSFTAILYGIRARSLRAAYKSYVRKRMTNSTLQHEIQQRLSPVDGGSPRPSSGAKSFRSCTPSPASSPIQTPRRLSTNDLRPPPMHFPMNTGPLLPFAPATTTTTTLKNAGSHVDYNNVNNHNSCHGNHLNDNNILGNTLGKPRKIRSFLHLPTQNDMQEFWSGLRRPNRSPTIIITHEIRLKESINSSFDSKSIASSPTAEQRL